MISDTSAAATGLSCLSLLPIRSSEDISEQMLRGEMIVGRDTILGYEARHGEILRLGQENCSGYQRRQGASTGDSGRAD